MIGLLLRLGMSERVAKGVAFIVVPLLAIGLLIGGTWWLRHDAYGDGQRAERAAWEKKAAEMEAQAAKLQRIADTARAQAEQLHRAAIARNRQEVDHAVRDIPDQGTSARQHARACLELRRQGKTSAACEPPPAR